MAFRKRVCVLIILLWAITVLAFAGLRTTFADTKTIHIGYQKYGTLTVAKALGNLDKRF